MKAPDKIYFPADGLPSYIDWDGSPIRTKQVEDSDVCYIRKNAIRNFIFKMIDALNDRHLLDAAIHCALNGIIEELDSL